MHAPWVTILVPAENCHVVASKKYLIIGACRHIANDLVIGYSSSDKWGPLLELKLHWYAVFFQRDALACAMTGSLQCVITPDRHRGRAAPQSLQNLGLDVAVVS